MFAGLVKIVSHWSCRTSVILKYFCPLCAFVNSIHFGLFFSDKLNTIFTLYGWPDLRPEQIV